MPISLDPALMRAIIMDHYQNPRRKEKTDDLSYQTVHMDSASCIDDIYLQVKLEGERIVDVKWHGECCAISAASTSIMAEMATGRTVDEALEIYDNFERMLSETDYDSDLLAEANCFANTARQPSRIGCATIGWRGLLQVLKGDGREA